MSIRSKILLVLLTILIVITLLITLIWYRSATDIAEIYLNDISESIMTDAYTAFDYLLTDTAYMLTLVSINQDNIVKPISRINQIELLPNRQLGYDYLQNRRIITAYLRSINGYKYYIVGLGVVSKNGYVFQTSNFVQNIEELFDMIAQINAETIGKSMVMMSPVPTTGTWFNMKSNFVVPAVRAITDERQNIIGYAIMYFDYSVIEDIFSNNLPINSRFQVTDDDGNLIFSNCGEKLLDIEQSESGYVYSTYHASKVNWSFIMAIPSGPILSRTYGTLQLTASLLIVTIISAGFLCIVISSRITGNIQILNHKMNKVAGGDLSVDKQVKSRDEIGQMEDTFNHMVKQIEVLMDTVTEKEKQKRLFEIAFLQAQINPHFVSNTLNLISWMAKLQHADNIISVTNALNSMLRGAMKKNDDLIPLSDEIEYVKNYIEIIECTGNYDFDTIINIDPTVEILYILRFILQPIVENAVYHGLQTRLDKKGILTIHAHEDKNDLKIVIEDNGVGMTQENIYCVLNKKSEQPVGLSGIGISNVRERIQLFFGTSYGLNYESRLGEYTRVILTLPLIAELEGDKNWNE